MNREFVKSLVREAIANYRYEPPTTDTTIGVPWSAEKVYAHVEQLKAALVEPYLQRFELRESPEQIMNPQPTYAEFWVIAEEREYMEWYDPATVDFGLGMRAKHSATPTSIGIRGDLIGVYCAM